MGLYKESGRVGGINGTHFRDSSGKKYIRITRVRVATEDGNGIYGGH